MKKLFIVAALFFCLGLYACSQAAEYRNDLDTEDILKGAPHTVRSADDYATYDDELVEFFFGDMPASRDHTVLYSIEQNDIDEVGVFRAENESEALEIYEKATAYIREMQETQRAFIASYAPEELPKLDSAEVRRYGDYVVYAILSEGDSDAFFSHVEGALKR